MKLKKIKLTHHHCGICGGHNTEYTETRIMPKNKFLAILIGRPKVMICQSCISRLFRGCNSRF